MGELWTDERQADLERWQAIQEEAANPQDYLVAGEIILIDRLRGVIRYTVLAIRYWAIGGHKPWPLRQHTEVANIQRQLRADPDRLKERREWLKADPMVGDPFEGLFFDND